MRWSTTILMLGAAACKRDAEKLDPSSEPFSDTAKEDTEDTADGVDSDGEPDTAEPVDTDEAEGDTDTPTEAPTAVPGGTGVEADGDDSLIVADSVREYSATQGDDGWYYGYVEPGTSPAWMEMADYLSGGSTPGWYSDPAHYWTSLGSDAAHPNGLVTSEGRSPMEQWSVRRWVSDEVGLLHVYSHIAKNYEDGTTNGIDARVMVDGVEAASWRIQGWDTVGVDDVVDVVVRMGSEIDFVLDPHDAEDLSDRTTWTIVITR